VFMTSGLDDAQTPSRTAEAMAAAGRVPFAGRRRSPSPGMVLRGFEDGSLPQQDNVTGWDGSELSAGFAQFRGGGHFVIYRDAKARDLFRNFVGTALEGAPVVTSKR
jgi:hypothetical protein